MFFKLWIGIVIFIPYFASGFGKTPNELFEDGRKYQYSDFCAVENIPSSLCTQMSIESYKMAWKQIIDGEAHDFYLIGMLNDIGALLLTQSRISEAEDFFQEILRIEPHHTLALANMGHVSSLKGMLDESEYFYKKSLDIDSSHPIIWYNLGLVNYRQKKISNAQSCWKKTLELNKNMIPAIVNLAASVCHSTTESQKYYSDGLTTLSSKDRNGYWGLRIQAHASIVPILPRSMHHLKISRSHFVVQLLRDIQEMPSDLAVNVLDNVGCTFVGYYLIYHGFEDMFVRQLYAFANWKLSYHSLHFIAPFLINDSASYSASHFARQLLTLQNNDMYPQNSHTNKIKIAFLSAFNYRHSVGLLLRGVIRNLNRNVFDVYVLQIHPLLTSLDKLLALESDYVYQDMKYDPSLTFLEFQLSLADLQLEISKLELDILVFGEIGMDITTYFLSFSRLARRSIQFWGHAATSGISDLVFQKLEFADMATDLDNDNDRGGPDYFLSSSLFESNLESTPFEYTEKLLLLDGLTTYFEWPIAPLHADEMLINAWWNQSHHLRPTKTLVHSNRLYRYNLSVPFSLKPYKEWTLPSKFGFLCLYLNLRECYLLEQYLDDIVLITIPQTLYKLHVDMDPFLFRMVTELSSRVFVVLLEDIEGDFKRELETRWKSSGYDALVASNRLLWLPTLSERDFMTIISISDLIVDAFPLGGGRSSLEIFASGTPILVVSPQVSDHYPFNVDTETQNDEEDTTPVGTSPTILQLTLAMYDVMGLRNIRLNRSLENESTSHHQDYFCCVYKSVDEMWDNMAVLVEEESLRNSLRDLILQRNHLLFENRSVLIEWESMLLYVLYHPRPIPNVLKSGKEMNAVAVSSQCRNVSSTDYRWLHIWCKYFHQPNNRERLKWHSNELMHAVFSYDTAVTWIDIQDWKTALLLELKDNSSSSLSFSFVNDDNVIEIGIPLIQVDDWRTLCSHSLWSQGVHDPLKWLNICSFIGRNIERIHYENQSIPFFLSQDKSVTDLLSFFISPLDDFRMGRVEIQTSLTQISDQLSCRVYQQVVNQMTQDISSFFGSERNILLREALSRRMLCESPWYFSFSRLSSQRCLELLQDDLSRKKDDQIALKSMDFRITLALTTSRRLEYFMKTMKRLEQFLGPLPNAWIVELLVVDDGSSVQDRQMMMNSFPQATFIFKSPSQKGHAVSMNMIWKHVSTPYLFYIEDDWLASNPILTIPSLYSSYTTFLSILEQKISLLNTTCRLSFSRRNIPFYYLLLHSMSILGYHGILNIPCNVLLDCPTSDIPPIDIEIEQLFQENDIQVDEVLFNDQTTRHNAEFRHELLSSDSSNPDQSFTMMGFWNSQLEIIELGFGGWKKVRNVMVNQVNLSMTYQLHEFGFHSEKFCNVERSHDFSYWPGLSLNPGLWNVNRIRSRIERTTVNSTASSSSSVFNPDAKLFEQEFSAIAFGSGLHVAYLPALVFRHIGQTSAYLLANASRPWD